MDSGWKTSIYCGNGYRDNAFFFCILLRKTFRLCGADFARDFENDFAAEFERDFRSIISSSGRSTIS